LPQAKKTPASQTGLSSGARAFSQLVKEALGVYAQLTTEGDRLGADFGLSSARWQVIGAIRSEAKSVSDIARERGLARQSVQRVINTLKRQGYVRFRDNPRHARAKLVEITPKGLTALTGVAGRQADWAEELAQSFTATEMANAAKVLNRLRGLF
jgi:DNA-binding MarR family transcriptional regulator